MSHLSFEAFTTAARFSPDLSKDEEASVRDQYDPTIYVDGIPAGRVYPCGLVIEDWERAPLRAGGGEETFRFYLQIGNREWLAHELAALEPQLYEFYVSECVG